MCNITAETFVFKVTKYELGRQHLLTSVRKS